MSRERETVGFNDYSALDISILQHTMLTEPISRLTFRRLDLPSAQHIARRVFERYSTGGKVSEVGVRSMIGDAYSAVNKAPEVQNDDVAHFLGHYDRTHKGHLDFTDMESACMNYLLGPKGRGLNIFSLQEDGFNFLSQLMLELSSTGAEDDPTQWRQLFEKYDADGDGFLVKPDVYSLLADTYSKGGRKGLVNDKSASHYFALLDRDQDGKVSFQEFEDYFLRAVKNRNIQI